MAINSKLSSDLASISLHYSLTDDFGPLPRPHFESQPLTTTPEPSVGKTDCFKHP